MKIIQPLTSSDFEKYYQLRWEILRKPWNQPEGSEKDNMEDTSIHALMLDDNNEAIAVCRIQMNDATTAQVRFMAVAENQQGKGIGSKILDYIEQKAIEQGAKKMILDARDNAVIFYEHNGYQLLEKGHLLYGSIQHYKMKKTLC
jgi:N-acetylglutamate synthase-like GNAT family acetyltransferase